MIKLNGVKLLGNTLKLHLKSLGSTANSLGDLYSLILSVQFSSGTQSCRILCDPHGLQHTSLPCPSSTPGVYSNSCPSSRWCHLTISFSVIPFSSCLQSFPASGSFQMNQFFTSDGQSIGVSASASVLPMNIQDWFPLGWTDWISLLSISIINLLNFPTYWRKM